MSSLLDDEAASAPEPGIGPVPGAGVPSVAAGAAPGVVAGVADGAVAGLRAKPSTIGGAVYLLVVAATLVGLGFVEWGSWRLGIKVIGAAVLVAALARAVLSNFNSGMLRVRSKPFDLVVLTTLGTLLIVLAIVVPDQAV